MNPLTLVKRIQKLNSTESALGISEEASWHTKYKDSAYVYVGGIPFDLTEGDLLAVFAQYGEIVDVNLVRDKSTGKSKGFAFLAYEDQRSTILAVDNLNGAKILGRIVRVDHVSKYKKKEEEEDEDKEKQKREARGVCRAFQKGECNRGDSCRFSHDEQRNANTGWGAQDSNSRWGHDKYDDPSRSRMSTNSGLRRSLDDNADDRRSHHGRNESTLKNRDRFERSKYSSEKILERHQKDTRTKEDKEIQTSKRQYHTEPTREDYQDRRIEKRSRHDQHESSHRHRGR